MMSVDPNFNKIFENLLIKLEKLNLEQDQLYKDVGKFNRKEKKTVFKYIEKYNYKKKLEKYVNIEYNDTDHKKSEFNEQNLNVDAKILNEIEHIHMIKKDGDKLDNEIFPRIQLDIINDNSEINNFFINLFSLIEEKIKTTASHE